MTQTRNAERPRTAAPSADRPDLPRFPDWVAETYETLAHIQNLRHTPPTTPRQLATSEPMERKCRR